jgi:hypothetical protein
MPAIQNTYEQSTIIQCDTFDCGNTTEFDIEDTMPFIKQQILLRGWVYFNLNGKPKWVCPTCISKSKSEEKKLKK